MVKDPKPKLCPVTLRWVADGLVDARVRKCKAVLDDSIRIAPVAVSEKWIVRWYENKNLRKRLRTLATRAEKEAKRDE